MIHIRKLRIIIMESIIYNKFLGQCLWTLCLKTMRGTGIGMVSMSPIMNPQSRGATVRIFSRIIFFLLHAHGILASVYFGKTHMMQHCSTHVKTSLAFMPTW